MALKCNSHNTDYRTKVKERFVQKLGNDTIIWVNRTKSRIVRQLTINFN